MQSPSSAAARHTVGIDVGGTFTDCVVLHDDGTVTAGKALSTPPDFLDGVLNAVADAAATLETTTRELLAATRLLVHGTTIAENALVQGKHARAGLLTTRGFEDTILIMRVRGRWTGLNETELTHIVHTDKPTPIIPRNLIEGIVERIDTDGDIVTPLDVDDAERAVRVLLERGAESFAISLLWSHVNPAHEQALAEVVRRVAPGAFVTTGSELAPYIGEYERTATVAINACLGSIAGQYISSLSTQLEKEGLTGQLLITQGYGGALRAEVAARNAVGLVESGPASGLIASRFVGQAKGIRNIIATDMGGTTFKVGLIADGGLEHAVEPNFGKYTVMVPKIDVRSIGAGGGSIASIHPDAGTLQVGPQSAGASPGPVCYRRGGRLATLTDADLVLGYLNPDFFLGGKMGLDLEGAERAIEEQIARPLGMTLLQAAAGIYTIACSESADLIRRVSIERGYDPRDFTIFAYGGAGPVHAGIYSHHLGASRILVPFTASVNCAMGAVCADVVRENGLSDQMRFPLDPARVNANFQKLEDRAREDLKEDGFADAAITLRRSIDLKFRRQVHVVRMPVPAGSLSDEDLARLETEFEEAYERRNGKGSAFRAAGTEAVTFVVDGIGQVTKPSLRALPSSDEIPTKAYAGTRRAAFVDPENPIAREPTVVVTPIYRLPGLVPGNRLDGPAIIETPVTTIVVQPSQTASVDPYLNVVIDLEVAS